MTRRAENIQPAYFDAMYAADPDPWRFASSDYEREKYAATLAALPDRPFACALEIGCSIGVLTAYLVSRAASLLAIDVAEQALDQARARCAAFPHVTFARRSVPSDWPDGGFDLIVLSEVLYYLDRPALEQTAALAASALNPGGCMLLVHYLGGTDYPLTGDEAAEAFIAASGARPTLQTRAEGYRIDRLERP